MLKDRIELVTKEHDELAKMIDRLEVFISKESFKELPKVERVAMRAQLTHMNHYKLMLQKRLMSMKGRV